MGSNLKWVWCTRLKQTHPGPQQSPEQQVCSRQQFQREAEVSTHNRTPPTSPNRAHNTAPYIIFQVISIFNLPFLSHCILKGKNIKNIIILHFAQRKIYTSAAYGQTSAMAASVLAQFHNSPHNDNMPMIQNPRIHLGCSMLDCSPGAECEWRRSSRYLGQRRDQVNLNSRPALMILCC